MKSFPVKPKQKVSGILKQHPQTYQVFRKHGCPEDKLLNDLNELICPQQDRSE